MPKKDKIRHLTFEWKKSVKEAVRIIAVTQVVLLLLAGLAFVSITEDVKEEITSSLTWYTETVDPIFVEDLSIAVDGNRNPHIAYYDMINADLKYAVKSGTNWINETVDSVGVVGIFSSIAIDSNGNPHISYRRGASTLKYAVKSGGIWSIETISTGTISSITIDGSDNPRISYFWGNISTGMKDLRYGVKSGVVWNIEAVEAYLNNTGEGGISIKLDSNGDPHISYLANASVRYATKSGATWSIETIDSGAISSMETSIALDASDNPHISYWNESNWDLKYAIKVGASWSIETVESIGGTVGGSDNSIAVNSSGDPRIGYPDFENGYVKYAVQNGSNWIIDTVDVGSASSMALDSNDNPHVSYDGGSDLKYATLRADLEVTSSDIVFKPPSPVKNGSSVLINATIHNVGDGNANNVIIRFYDGVPPGVQIGLDQTIASIAGRSYGYAEVAWSASPIGTHNIYVVVDPDNMIEENDEFNNIANRTIEVGGYDYVPWNTPSAQQKVSVGSSVVITSQVKNAGDINATVESTIAFYNQSDLPFKTYTVPPLNVSEVSIEYNAIWTAPTISGTYYVLIKADYYNDIEELDEDNNTYVIEFNVTDKPITTIHVGSPQYSTILRYVNSSTQFWFSVIDPSGTGYSTYYYIDTLPWNLYTGLFTVPMEGAHIIYYNSTDNLGGVEDTKEFDIIVDNTPPTTTINIGSPKYISSDTWVTSTTEFNLSAMDGGLIPVGLNFTEYRIWNGSWSDWDIYQNEFALGANDGMRYVEFYSTDLLGNEEPVQNRSYIVDNTSPITTIDPNKKNVKLGTQFTIIATDGDGCGFNYTEYSIDDGDWDNYTSPFSIDTYGHHNITYRSIDNLGNIETEKTLWIYIPENPITTIHVGTPQYGTIPLYVTLSTQFTFIVEDYSGTGFNTYYYVDNPPWNLYSGAFTIPTEGEHTIYFNSSDNLGNVEDTKSYTVIVDNIPPTTTISPNMKNVALNTMFTLIATDGNGSGVNYTQYSIDSSNWMNYSEPFAINTYGHHNITYRSVDNLCNVEGEKTLWVVISPPEVTEEEYNYKPLIASIFSIALLLIGTCVSYKKPLKFKGKEARNKLYTWFIAPLPFIIAEAVTGIVSLLTGFLSVPPLVGLGMVVDLVILIIGLIVFMLVYKKKPKAEE